MGSSTGKNMSIRSMSVCGVEGSRAGWCTGQHGSPFHGACTGKRHRECYMLLSWHSQDHRPAALRVRVQHRLKNFCMKEFSLTETGDEILPSECTSTLNARGCSDCDSSKRPLSKNNRVLVAMQHGQLEGCQPGLWILPPPPPSKAEVRLKTT